jgi:hypothetical protein
MNRIIYINYIERIAVKIKIKKAIIEEIEIEIDTIKKKYVNYHQINSLKWPYALDSTLILLVVWPIQKTAISWSILKYK